MKKIYIVGHENADFDTMASCVLVAKMIEKTNDYQPILCTRDNFIDSDFVDAINKISPDNNYEWIELPSDPNIKIIQVDHYKPDHRTVAVFDHHSDINIHIKKNQIVAYINPNATSCAIWIRKFIQKETITKEIDLLTILSCYIDSLSFQSTKANKDDYQICQDLIKKYKLNESQIRTWGYGYTKIDKNEKFLKNGWKEYENNLTSSYIISNKQIPFEEYCQKLQKKLKQSHENIYHVYIWTNLNDKTTTIGFIQRTSILIRKYPKLLSRGNDIIPNVKQFLMINK